nr:tetratricopeptide repeat protein [Candidatus Njordarchaeum guaymaensis]
MSSDEKEPSHKKLSSARGSVGGKANGEDYGAAIEKFEAIIKSGNADVGTWIALGNAYNASGLYDKAIKCYDKALLLSYNVKDEVSILGNLASAYGKIGDFEKEAECYTNLLKKSQADPSIWGKTARAYERISKTQEATLYYTRAIQLNPNDPDLLYNYSYFCEKLGQGDNAIAALEKALILKPNSLRLLERLSLIYGRIFRYENASRYRLRMLQLDSKNIERWEDLALAYKAADKTKDAVKVLNKGILRNNDASLWDLLGDIHIDQNKPGNALYCYEVAAGKGHKDAEIKAEKLRQQKVIPKEISLRESAVEGL